ncbi:MAG: sugar nucleotide-binding protein, partial [Candidatus Micrarchaeia archaeon]
MKKAFILGAHGGIGAAVVSKFKKEGFETITPEKGELDLESPDSINKYFTSKIPDVSVLVHCAGINNPKPAGEITSEDALTTF